MTAVSAGPRNSFEAKITWMPADLGQPNKLHVEIFDANQLEPRSPLAVRYDIKIYKGDKYLRPAEPTGNDAVQNEDFSHDYTFVFLQEGSYELAIEEIEHEGENIRIPIQVTPEFPIGMIGMVAAVIGAGGQHADDTDSGNHGHEAAGPSKGRRAGDNGVHGSWIP